MSRASPGSNKFNFIGRDYEPIALDGQSNEYVRAALYSFTFSLQLSRSARLPLSEGSLRARSLRWELQRCGRQPGDLVCNSLVLVRIELRASFMLRDSGLRSCGDPEWDVLVKRPQRRCQRCLQPLVVVCSLRFPSLGRQELNNKIC